MARIRKINVSQVEGNNNGVLPAGTIVAYEVTGGYVLRVHDGVTAGGVSLNAGQTPVIFNGTDGIVVGNLNNDIAALFNNGNVYITGGESLRFTGLDNIEGGSSSVLRFWNGEGRHSLDNDTTELVTLNVGNDADEGTPTLGFFKIITEKQVGGEKEWKFDADGVLTLPTGGDILDSNGNSVLGGATGDANIWVQTFETDTPATDIVQVATSVEYDGNGNIIALFAHYDDGVELNGSTYYSVGKYTATGAKIWTARLLNSFYTDGWGLAVDTENNWIYVAGVSSTDEVGDYNVSLLTKFDGGTGGVEWSKSYDFGFGCQSPVVDVDSEGNPIVVGYAYNGDDNYVTTTKINADTGEVIWSRALEGQGAEEAYGMAVGPDGEVVTVGYMDLFDIDVSHSVTPLTGSATNILVINRSDLIGDILTDTWEVSGTGITGTIGVNAINFYSGLTGTVQQGTGAVFEISDVGNGTYNPAGVQNAGTNYLPGHKIKILGTDLGGATPANDCIITVDSIDPGGLIYQWSVAGTAAGTVGATYGPVTGTNYQTGSGLTFNFFGDSGSTYTEHPIEITAVGTNYVLDDVITISGALLGGTSPENDLIGTVNADSGSVINFMSFSGNQQTTTYRVRTEDNGIDFSGTGTWTLSGTVTDTDDRMLVVKYNTLGAIQWQKAILFDEGFDCSGADADIDSDGNIYVCGQYESDTLEGPVGQAMSIVKFNSSGVKQWMRRVDGNCGGWTSSIVVGPDDKLYLSATTFAGTDSNNLDVSTVLAKYNLDGTVAWQRLLDYTEGLSFGGTFFFGPGGGSIGSGSNLAVKQGYVAVGLAFSSEFFGDPEDFQAAVAQVSAEGDLFTVGTWDFKAANFSGTLDDDASEITVVNAGKTDLELSSGVDGDITTTTVSPMSDVADFLLGTLYTAGGGDDRLVSGANQLTLETTGTLTLPSGGTISEGVVTSNPTIQLTPASPTVASQKLVIKGGGNYSNTENGITVTLNNITQIAGDVINVYVESVANADQTLYWWIYPAGAVLADPATGTVVLDEFGDGLFTFELDSDAYEFTVRVSPENNNYDSETIGVESVLINGDEPTYGAEHHLHLTTGDLAETSIFLGTDDHNVRTTVDGGISMTTIRGTVLFGNIPDNPITGSSHFHIMKDDAANVDLFFGDDDNYVKLPSTQGVEVSANGSIWSFGTDGTLTFPSGETFSNGQITAALGGDAGLADNTNNNFIWVDSNGAYIETDDEFEHTWTFGTDGTTTFPQNTIKNVADTSIKIGNPLVSGVVVATVDELIPPGDVWRLFIDSDIYPALGTTVHIGGTVTTAWGTPITATITDIQQDTNTDRWIILVAQDITAGFDAGPRTVSFAESYKTWTFGTDGTLILPTVGKIASGTGTAQVGSTTTIATDSEEGTGAGTPGVVDVPFDGTLSNTYPAGSTITFANGDVRTITSIVQGNVGLYLDISYSGTATDSSPEFPIILKTANYAAAIPAPEWTFGNNGDLTLPTTGDIVNDEGESFLKDIPQNYPTGYSSGFYALQASDRGRHILIDGSEGTSIQVPTDATAPMPIGSAIVLVIKPGMYNVFVGAEDYDAMVFHGAGVDSNGAFQIDAGNGGAMATLVKIGANEWMISGTGLAEYTGP